MGDSLFASTSPPPATVTVMEYVTQKSEMAQRAAAAMLSDHMTQGESKHPTITAISWAQQFPEIAGVSQEAGSVICLDFSDGYEEHYSGHNDPYWSRLIAMLCTLPWSRREQIVKGLLGFQVRKEM